jgi:hypothetical protein
VILFPTLNSASELAIAFIMISDVSPELDLTSKAVIFEMPV